MPWNIVVVVSSAPAQKKRNWTRPAVFWPTKSAQCLKPSPLKSVSGKPVANLNGVPATAAALAAAGLDTGAAEGAVAAAAEVTGEAEGFIGAELAGSAELAAGAVPPQAASSSPPAAIR